MLYYFVDLPWWDCSGCCAFRVAYWFVDFYCSGCEASVCWASFVAMLCVSLGLIVLLSLVWLF